jgi:hypothetical protein
VIRIKAGTGQWAKWAELSVILCTVISLHFNCIELWIKVAYISLFISEVDLSYLDHHILQLEIQQSSIHTEIIGFINTEKYTISNFAFQAF